MKKQILSLLLSAAIFTTSPLFAMDSVGESEDTSSIPVCSSCYSYEVKDTAQNGKGILHAFPNEMIVRNIPSDLPTVTAASMTSKTMYNFFLDPRIWQSLSEEHSILLNPEVCIKEQFQKYWYAFKGKCKVDLSSKFSDDYEYLKHEHNHRVSSINFSFLPTVFSEVTPELGNIFALLGPRSYVNWQHIYDEPAIVITETDANLYDENTYDVGLDQQQRFTQEEFNQGTFKRRFIARKKAKYGQFAVKNDPVELAIFQSNGDVSVLSSILRSKN